MKLSKLFAALVLMTVVINLFGSVSFAKSKKKTMEETTTQSGNVLDVVENNSGDSKADVSGEVKEEALEYIDAQYGSDGEGDTSYRIGWDYQVGLSLPRNNSTFSIDVSRDSVPEDAQVFPDEEEQEALLLDPIARLGIDQDVEVPETVLLEQDDMRVVLEGAVYRNDDIALVIRGENIPDEIHTSVMLNELNGSGLLSWEDTQRTLETAYFDNDEPHDPVMTELIYIGYKDILNNIPGFTGISTLKLRVKCEKDPAAVNAAIEVIASGSTVVETGY